MPSSTPGLTAIVTRIKRGPERSSLFHFMVEHHDQLARATSVPWTELVGLFMAEGLTAVDGGPITEAIARHVWWPARKAVEKEREPKAAVKAAKVSAARTLMPSALPQSWRPTQVLLPPAPLPDPVPSRPERPRQTAAAPAQPTPTPNWPGCAVMPMNATDASHLPPERTQPP